MPQKTKTAPAENGKKDSMKMIFLAWLLTILTVPAVSSLVPAYFYPENKNILTPDGEIAWLLVLQDMIMFMLPFLFVTLVIPFIVSLLCKREFPGVFTGPVKRYVFLLSSAINVFAILFFLYGLLMSLFGYWQ
ncbi:MAG: hypothetical protein FJZ04_04200 [Candidatus Moranbacteria bacterium]|nr:hypothetical protein [Candidatus Moranbacteria bacterium]